ncbi:class I tRNA ligase family protein, partial [Candidatus Bathyarchaeota archaeon]|nr:class I tRNA ligase family protein [Candidatus Bathyarchaeota archaeon]
ESVREVKGKLESFYNLTNSLIEAKREDEKVGHLEKWLISILEHRTKKVTESMEIMKTRTAIENVFFEVWNDFRWYKRRKERSNTRILREAMETWIRLLAPFAPYICEELWSKLGRESFISFAEWPTYDKKKVDVRAEETESLIKNVLDDTFNILRATKIKPKRIYYYSAAPWKWKIYLKLMEKSVSTRVVQSEVMRELIKDPDMKRMADKVAKFVHQVIDEINRMPDDKRNRQLKAGVIDENQALKEAEAFFDRELNAKILTYPEEDAQRHDPKKRARLAKPYRPAIYIQ